MEYLRLFDNLFISLLIVFILVSFLGFILPVIFGKPYGK